MNEWIKIDLSHNEISDIWALGQLSNLEILDLSYNQIVMCHYLLKLKKLKQISINHNDLVFFDDIHEIERKGVSVWSDFGQIK